MASLKIEEDKKEEVKVTSKEQTDGQGSKSASFISQSTDDKQKNEIDIYRIMNGEEPRTTVMIRNIPNKFKQMTLLEMINENH